jgi:3-methyladenine DNA glycosylase AlkD
MLFESNKEPLTPMNKNPAADVRWITRTKIAVYVSIVNKGQDNKAFMIICNGMKLALEI